MHVQGQRIHFARIFTGHVEHDIVVFYEFIDIIIASIYPMQSGINHCLNNECDYYRKN